MVAAARQEGMRWQRKGAAAVAESEASRAQLHDLQRQVQELSAMWARAWGKSCQRPLLRVGAVFLRLRKRPIGVLQYPCPVCQRLVVWSDAKLRFNIETVEPRSRRGSSRSRRKKPRSKWCRHCALPWTSKRRSCA